MPVAKPLLRGRATPAVGHEQSIRSTVEYGFKEETNMSELRIQTKAERIAMRAIRYVKKNKSLSTK
jgi:hypothetical protein